MAAGRMPVPVPAPADVLLVSLGSTGGLRAADAELAGAMRRAGARVDVRVARAQRDVRTLALTDLIWARAARAAARAGLEGPAPRAVLYSTITAALLGPTPGAIRFDAISAANRPGRHGIWQRPAERWRLRAAPLLVPWSPDGLREAGLEGRRAVVVPVPIQASGAAPGAGFPQRDLAAITYAADPEKKGLDRVLDAWEQIRRPGESIAVCGTDRVPPGEGIQRLGRLERNDFRALLRRARAFVIAPRREDYGLVQLEALADGARLVTSEGPGPYVALELARALDPALVGDDLAGALRRAIDAGPDDYATRAAALLAPYRSQAIDRVVAERLLPALLGS